MRMSWDGHFRFPRHHIKGKSFPDFSLAELQIIRCRFFAIWEAYRAIRLRAAKKGIELPVWPQEVHKAHNLEVEVIREIDRRRRSRFLAKKAA